MLKLSCNLSGKEGKDEASVRGSVLSIDRTVLGPDMCFDHCWDLRVLGCIAAVRNRLVAPGHRPLCSLGTVVVAVAGNTRIAIAEQVVAMLWTAGQHKVAGKSAADSLVSSLVDKVAAGKAVGSLRDTVAVGKPLDIVAAGWKPDIVAVGTAPAGRMAGLDR